MNTEYTRRVLGALAIYHHFLVISPYIFEADSRGSYIQNLSIQRSYTQGNIVREPKDQLHEATGR